MLQSDNLATLFEDKARSGGGNPYKSLRYMVIEDQEASRQTLKICIQSMGGFTVDQAQAYMEAITRIRNNMPDVIICDYMLGPGRTGQQLLEELRRTGRLPDMVSFIMVTAERAYEQVVSAVELVPDDYIIKPFSPETLRVRMERVILKKIFFRTFYELKAKGSLDEAVTELGRLEAKPQANVYRFEIMRVRAETLTVSGRAEEALHAYECIVAIHPFPWAKAGMARAYRALGRFDEASSAIDEAIAKSNDYFDAYDIKAGICVDQGNFTEAQRILTEAAARTPRNWQRKRMLSRAAQLNGDHDTARRLMEEVMANDMVGNVVIRDKIELARNALQLGDQLGARAALAGVSTADAGEVNSPEYFAFSCISSMLMDEDAGEKQFNRVRSDLLRIELPIEVTIDAIRAALLFSDRELADKLTEKCLAGHNSKQAFGSIREIYMAHELDDRFKKIQLGVATRRLKNK